MTYSNYKFSNLEENKSNRKLNNREILETIPLDFEFRIGTKKCTLPEINHLQKGTMIEIEAELHLPIDIIVGGKKVGTGIVHQGNDGKIFIKVI